MSSQSPQLATRKRRTSAPEVPPSLVPKVETTTPLTAGTRVVSEPVGLYEAARGPGAIQPPPSIEQPESDHLLGFSPTQPLRIVKQPALAVPETDKATSGNQLASSIDAQEDSKVPGALHTDSYTHSSPQSTGTELDTLRLDALFTTPEQPQRPFAAFLPTSVYSSPGKPTLSPPLPQLDVGLNASDVGGVAEHTTHTAVIARRSKHLPKLLVLPLVLPRSSALDTASQHNVPNPVLDTEVPAVDTMELATRRATEKQEIRRSLKRYKLPEGGFLEKRPKDAEPERSAEPSSPHIGAKENASTNTGATHPQGAPGAPPGASVGVATGAAAGALLGTSAVEPTSSDQLPEPEVHLPPSSTVSQTSHRRQISLASQVSYPPPENRYSGLGPSPDPLVTSLRLKFTRRLTIDTPLLAVAEQLPRISDRDTQFTLKYLPDDGYTLPYSLGTDLAPGTAHIIKAGDKPRDKKVVINPFDVLYDLQQPPPVPPKNGITNGTYKRVALGVVPPVVGHRRVISELAPVITVLSPELLRLGLVVSREMTLRNRNSLKKRNKMVKKKDLERRSLKKGEADKPLRLRRFLFPIRRQRSFKYKPLAKQIPDFELKSQLEEYMTRSNAFTLVRELLPKQLDFYRYNKLYLANPHRHKNRHGVQIGRDGSIKVVTPSKRPQISAPIRETFRKNGEPMDMLLLKLYDAVYLRYRKSVFDGGYLGVPKFDQVYPNDLLLLLRPEIARANRTMTLEVLLRRTVAAKIGWRLQQHRKSESSHGRLGLESLGPLFQFLAGKQSAPHEAPPALTRDTSLDLAPDDDEAELINTEIIMQDHLGLMEDDWWGKVGTPPSRSPPPPPKSSPPPQLMPYQTLDSFPGAGAVGTPHHLNDAVLRLNMYQLKPVARLEATILLESDSLLTHAALTPYVLLLLFSLKKKLSVSTEKRTLVTDLVHPLPFKTGDLDYALLFETGVEEAMAVKQGAMAIQRRPPKALVSALKALTSVEYKNHLSCQPTTTQPMYDISLMRGSILELLSARWSGSQRLDLPTRRGRLHVIHLVSQVHL